MNDAVRRGGGLPQAAEIVEGAPVHLGAEGLQRRSGRIRTGKADDVVPGFEQLGDNGGPDVAGRSGDEYPHGNTSCFGQCPPM